MARRQHLTLSLLLIVVFFFTASYFFSSPSSHHGADLLRGATQRPQQDQPQPPAPAPALAADDDGTAKKLPAQEAARDSGAGSDSKFSVDLEGLPSLEGDSIAPKLENATLKAELGRATWRFLHTMMARFPDKPTQDERKTLETFMHLFSRLYPCGDCARHFRQILEQYPPQTSSRNAAAGWLCFAHNLVNKRLEKPEFDCNKIGDFYDCGCAEDGKKDGGTEGAGSDKKKEEDAPVAAAQKAEGDKKA